MAEPQVSILITAHMHERYLARALESALEQRGVASELLVGADASTDATALLTRHACLAEWRRRKVEGRVAPYR